MSSQSVLSGKYRFLTLPANVVPSGLGSLVCPLRGCGGSLVLSELHMHCSVTLRVSVVLCGTTIRAPRDPYRLVGRA